MTSMATDKKEPTDEEKYTSIDKATTRYKQTEEYILKDVLELLRNKELPYKITKMEVIRCCFPYSCILKEPTFLVCYYYPPNNLDVSDSFNVYDKDQIREKLGDEALSLVKATVIGEKKQYIIPIIEERCKEIAKFLIFHFEIEKGKGEDAPIIFNSQLGVKIADKYRTSIYHFVELEKQYKNVAASLFQQRRRGGDPLIFELKQLLNNFRKWESEKETTPSERWLETIYRGLLLQDRIAETWRSRQAVAKQVKAGKASQPVNGEKKKTCPVFGKHLEGKEQLECYSHSSPCLLAEGGDSGKQEGAEHKIAPQITKEHKQCPCLLAFLRHYLWDAYQNKDARSFDGKDGKDFVEALARLDLPPQWDIAIPDAFDIDGVFEKLPQSLRQDIVKFSLEKRHRLEWLHTLLFSIYTLSLLYKGKAGEEAVEQIVDLWAKLKAGGDKNLSKLIEEYLCLWQGKAPDAGDKKGLFLSQEWLIAWFGIQLLSSQSFADYIHDKKFSPEETLKYSQKLATLFLYILFWIRQFGDTNSGVFADVEKGYQEFLDSLIYLLCEYAHIDGGLSRQAELYRTMHFMWSQQSVLYTMSDNYRDHLHHVLEVCLMGLFFMQIKRCNGLGRDVPFFPLDRLTSVRTGELGLKKFPSAFSSPSSDSDKENRAYVLRNWIIAALIHDVGYAVKLTGMPIEHLAFFQEKTISEFWEGMDRTYKRLKQELQPRIGDELKEVAPNIPSHGEIKELDHGFISALQIVHLVSVPDTAWKQDIELAVEAAAMHNHPAITMNPHSHPLAFLLFLCDNLQEWDRPFLKGENIRLSLLPNIVHTGENSLHQARSYIDYLFLEDVFIKSGARLEPYLKKGKTSLHYTLLFADALRMDYYPPLTWVGHTRSLQRVKGCNLPIIISLQHPVNKETLFPNKSALEMDLFQTFLLHESGRTSPSLRKAAIDSETGNAVLRQWVCDIRKNENWFGYRYEDKLGLEIVSFDLKKSDGRMPIPVEIQNRYIAHYIEWVNKYRKGIFEDAQMNSFN